MDVLRFKTLDGIGVAVKEKHNGCWRITLPIGSFRWYGSAQQVKDEIRRRVEPRCVTFDLTEVL